MDEGMDDPIDETIETEDVGIGGTSKQGTVKASIKDLRQHFGEPSTGYPKSTFHWQIRFEDGTVATIYDYYSSNRYADEDENVEWSVGGHSKEAINLLNYLGFEASTLV